jgi:hypothetical protein
MKLDRVAASGNDEFYTPAYAIRPIIEHLAPGSRIWCPFDTADSLFVKMLRAAGHVVIHTHIDDGHDFFEADPEKVQGFDYIVSNPPYSVKGDVLARLFDLGTPFAMLVGVVGLFESQKRFEMFAGNRFEILYLNRRVSYFQDYGDQKPALNPPFSSVYVCSGVLPHPICFAEVNKAEALFVESGDAA